MERFIEDQEKKNLHEIINERADNWINDPDFDVSCLPDYPETPMKVEPSHALPAVDQLAADYAKWYKEKAELLDIIFTCEEISASYKQTLETRKSYLFISGQINGKNEAERQAQIADLSTLCQEDYDDAAHLVDTMKLQLRLADLEIERCDKMLRLMELSHA